MSPATSMGVVASRSRSTLQLCARSTCGCARRFGVWHLALGLTWGRGAPGGSPNSPRCELSHLVVLFGFATDFVVCLFFWCCASCLHLPKRFCGAALSSVSCKAVLFLSMHSRTGVLLWVQALLEKVLAHPGVQHPVGSSVVLEHFGNPRFCWAAGWVFPTVTVHRNSS